MDLPAKKAKIETVEESLEEGTTTPNSDFSLNSSVVETEEPSDEEINEKDLPLLSNVDEVRVLHYLLKLNFDMESRSIKGILVLFLNPAESNTRKPWETTTLDSCCIKVNKVYIIKRISEFECDKALINSANNSNRKNFYRRNDTNWFSAEGSELLFCLNKWSLNIRGWPKKSFEECPSVIRIHYEVKPSTPSLHWRPTKGYSYKDGEKCVYTPGSPVNNRGLFPCQEPPAAMATWECLVTVQKGYLPFLASDEPGKIIEDNLNSQTQYFYSSMILPVSTFAIVIGKFPIQVPDLLQELVHPEVPENVLKVECNHDLYPCRLKIQECQCVEVVPMRLYSLDGGLDLDIKFLRKFLIAVMKSIFNLLGPHPFSRVDLIILPKYFADLGLCNPHLIFLSPSLFSGNDPLYLMRIPHEISHFWFGLLIGALDWLEEYLSEGFATFMEEFVYKEAIQKVRDVVDVQVEIDTKACVRLDALQNELRNTADEPQLQIMSVNINNRSESSSKSVINGLAPMKKFMQIHYLKGYFFLKYLSFLVGEERFLFFLKKYVFKFHGNLVTSETFLNFYFENFSEILISNPEFISLEVLTMSWLKMTQLPEPFKSCSVIDGKIHPKLQQIIPRSTQSLSKIQVAFDSLCCTSEIPERLLETFSISQKDIFLRKVVQLCCDKPNKKKIKMKHLYNALMTSNCFRYESQNPDICHLLCELVIFRKDLRRKHFVVMFLENNMSCGVYLYAELMISENRIFQKLAQDLLRKMIDVLDPSQKKLILEMVS